MERYSFVFTILFMLLGPIKAIGPFAAVTRDRDVGFQRAVAIRATLISGALMAFMTFAGGHLIHNYHITNEALSIAGGTVLLVAALRVMFGAGTVPESAPAGVSPMKLSVSPVASPIIVAPAGVAAILIFTMLAPRYEGMMQAIGISVGIILVLNFIAMYFNRMIVSLGPLMLLLQLLSAVLVFMQVALAIDTILIGLKGLGLVGAGGGSS
jgi:multiple antibiotic resistance protein